MGYALGTVVVLIAAFSGFVVVKSNSMLTKKYDAPAELLAAARDSASIARGEHLMRTIGMCVDCHTSDFGGKVMVDDPALGRLVSANLTRGNGGIADKYTDAQLALAIRHGIKSNGSPAIVMPSKAYQHLTDDDVSAIVGYVRTLPPIDRTLAKTELRFVGRTLMATNQLPILPAASIPLDRPHARTIRRDTTAAYGRYLASIAGCADCHGENLAGGMIPGMPPGTPPAANITPKGIGHYSDAELEKIMRTGTRPGGSQLNNEMPWRFIAGISQDEMAALIKYLRTVPSAEFGAR